MNIAYDTLGYSKALQKAGIPAKQADAHAEAVRDHVMPEIATKADISELRNSMKVDLQRLESLIERQTLQLTVRLGGMVIAGVAALAAFRFFA
ncbi:hypothetical protein C7441_11019 [Pseudaminobacter salicylatoxidans]|uniref:DUF1640 domain-containing protein n=1 Tax=Pseudaminobacter salicylatoxidans TaxID=93369 RepID=A0A316C2A9_PSESE|nr:hypothetical protein [Pseudaminobacter salicylatoxidans]PWJ81487.1 hypothetical protein C7441_11019 [Pseudaminobacter salicylatoxidans]